MFENLLGKASAQSQSGIRKQRNARDKSADQVIKPSLVERDQAWNNVTSDVPIAETPDLAPYSEITAP
jgi:hypothetical protein